MAATYVAGIILNPGSFTNPTNINDRNDGTAATKALTKSPIGTVFAAVQASDYSAFLGTTLRPFSFRVKHSCTTSGDAVGKLLTADISYSKDGGATFTPTTLTHSIADAALTFDDDRSQFISTPVDMSKLIIAATISIVANSGGSVTLNYTVNTIEVIPVFPIVGSMLGFM